MSSNRLAGGQLENSKQSPTEEMLLCHRHTVPPSRCKMFHKLPQGYHNFVSFQLFTLATLIYITETFFPVMSLQSSFSQIHAFILHASSDCWLLKSLCRKHHKLLHENFQVFLQIIHALNLLPAHITSVFLKK